MVLKKPAAELPSTKLLTVILGNVIDELAVIVLAYTPPVTLTVAVLTVEFACNRFVYVVPITLIATLACNVFVAASFRFALVRTIKLFVFVKLVAFKL